MLRQMIALGGAAAIIATIQLTTTAPSPTPTNPDSLVVHEWGTFTSLQDELGLAIGGINSDDAPVPEFVHRVARDLLIGPAATVPLLFKGAPRSHPDVTMRLETPVVYFHPPRGADEPLTVNLEVSFRSGWLSEYYPNAAAEAPGIHSGFYFGPIKSTTVGRLKWDGLRVGTDATGPETTDSVWLAPRAVDAANVTSADGESERYLFYRGVGRVDSPLRVHRDDSGKSLTIRADFPLLAMDKEFELVVPAAWLVEIRADKSCAFRELDGFRMPNDGRARVVATTASHFDEQEFQSGNLEALSAAMRAALIADGLFADEADALLTTWKESYFESPGIRLFYLLPRRWTDHVLPMQLSVESNLVRTMIGRIEIVTPEQRKLLAEIAQGPASDANWLLESSNHFGPQPNEPADYRAFQKLGRFRHALVLDELKRRPTPALEQFIEGYGFRAYTPVAGDGTP